MVDDERAGRKLADYVGGLICSLFDAQETLASEYGDDIDRTVAWQAELLAGGREVVGAAWAQSPACRMAERELLTLQAVRLIRRLRAASFRQLELAREFYPIPTQELARVERIQEVLLRALLRYERRQLAAAELRREVDCGA